MKVLVGCERSGAVRRAFREMGHDAYSCDLVPADDGSPYHYTCDIFHLDLARFDLMICHPPCTFLTASAEWAYKDPDFDRYPAVGYHQKPKDGTLTGKARREARDFAVEFCRALLAAPIEKIALENPIGALSARLRRPDQIIQPYFFGDDASKATCLWLKNLPPLTYSESHFCPPRIVNGKPRWANQTDSGQNALSPTSNRADKRSVTYEGIAAAMAEQWGGFYDEPSTQLELT